MDYILILTITGQDGKEIKIEYIDKNVTILKSAFDNYLVLLSDLKRSKIIRHYDIKMEEYETNF